MGARVALHALAFPLAVRAGDALLATIFRLPVRVGAALSALTFQPTMKAGVALPAVAFHLAVGAGVACTPRTCISPCHEDTGCTPCRGVSSSYRVGTVSFPSRRLRILSAHSAHVYRLIARASPCGCDGSEHRNKCVYPRAFSFSTFRARVTQRDAR